MVCDVVTPDLATEIAASDPDDLTTGCYVLADGGSGATDPHIVVDLHPERAGRCDAVAWDTYGLAGDMPIIAYTMTELLSRLTATSGTQATLPGPHHGDAYDM